MVSKYQIGSRKFPKRMIERFEKNEWKKPLNLTKLEKLVLNKNPFPLDTEYLKKEVKDFELYNLGLILSDTKYLENFKNTDSEIMFLGKKDTINSPGFIIPNKSLLFADFGIGSDTPFALDYSINFTKPRVLLLYWGVLSNKDNRWIKIADSFEEFDEKVW